MCHLAREVIFSVSGTPVKSVTSFNYLGHLLSCFGDDWNALHKNLDKVHLCWTLISHVLACKRASPQVSALFYKVAVQAVMFYSCEMWLITSHMFDVLESFHHHVARRLTHCHAFYLHHADLWVWPSITETLHMAGMFMIREYIS